MDAANWSPVTSSARAFVLAGEALGLGAALGLVEQLERRVRRLRHRADLRLEHAPGHLDGDGPLGESLDLAGLVLAVDLDGAAQHAVGPPQRVLEVVGGGEDRVDDAVVNACCGFSIRFCLSGFEMTTSSAFSMPMRFGSRYAPPQPGMMPRKTSGSAIAAAEASTVRYVELSDLEAAAEREPVDEGARARRARQLAEHVVPSCAMSRAVLRPDLRDVGQVGAGGEDVLLARDADGLDLAGGGARREPVERRAEP